MAKAADKAPAKAAEAHTYPDTEVDVRILSLRSEGSIRAVASANLNGVFAIRNIKIMEGKNGLFVSMPSSSQAPYSSLPAKAKSSLISLLLLSHAICNCVGSLCVGDDYKDIAFPVTKEFREVFNAAVLNAYQQRLEQTAKQAENAPSPEQAPAMSQSM